MFSRSGDCIKYVGTHDFIYHLSSVGKIMYFSLFKIKKTVQRVIEKTVANHND